ncbi:hypothetical protein Phou_090710 [Phytohabitans houttuyneae]|uniref:Uncharacterized protein n=1 Tax=Phytohabitans houttuyneae TaxID=1076126 RepID=A0A6V8KRB1_9ACTN|nr:hypothetical protein Phou_090710 [Phytohabitans houttuyneae]
MDQAGLPAVPRAKLLESSAVTCWLWDGAAAMSGIRLVSIERLLIKLLPTGRYDQVCGLDRPG